MNSQKMEIGKRYIVTKGSDDGTFEVGDHIHRYENGDIGCIEGMGWIEASDVPESSKGMEFEIDKDWAGRMKKRLMNELEKLA